MALLQIMDETQTQIAWPSKLKIGAKSKKGDDSFFLLLLLHLLLLLLLLAGTKETNGKSSVFSPSSSRWRVG